jgi:signal transduction histidine kinase/CheY-like chemotaxis protein
MIKTVPSHIQDKLNQKYLFYVNGAILIMALYYGIQVLRQIIAPGGPESTIWLQHGAIYCILFSVVFIGTRFFPIPSRFASPAAWLILIAPLAGLLRYAYLTKSDEYAPVLIIVSVIVGLSSLSYIWFTIKQVTLFAALFTLEVIIIGNNEFYLVNNPYYVVVAISVIVFLARMKQQIRHEQLELVQIENAAELEESKRFLKLILDHIPIGITWKDTNLVYQGTNRVVSKFLGLSRPEDIAGCTDEDFVPEPTVLQEVVQLDNDVMKTKKSKYGIIEFRGKENEDYQIMNKSKIPIFNHDDELVGILTTFENITEKIVKEEEQRKLEYQMQKAQKLESLGVLSGGIAHDFNNLLTGIIGNAELALVDTQGKTPEYLGHIQEASWKAQGLIRQLLDYSGKKFEKDEVFFPNVLIEELWPLITTSIRNKNVLSFRLGEGVPAISGVPSQFNQIVMNLLINASEALTSDDGTVSVETGVGIPPHNLLDLEQTESCESAQQFVFIRVADDGSGLSALAIQKIFDPFYSTKFTGRGLGLAAVQGIVRSHSGYIEVDSEVGKGTVFTVWLPASDEVPVEESEQSDLIGDLEKENIGGTVLVVDDDLSILKLTSQLLQNIGYDFETAESGEEGLKLLGEFPDRFDAAVIDMTMPKMSGEELLKAIRARTDRFPILLCSGYSREDFNTIISDDASTDFISKPFKIHELKEKLNTLILNANGQCVSG